MRVSFLIYLILLTGVYGYTQSFNALHGSNEAGSLGVSNNPASIVNTQYKWDCTLFAVQYQTLTNAVAGPNFPFLLLHPDGPFDARQGNFARKLAGNFNLRLLNARIALDKNRAIAFGVNVNAYMQAKTNQINYNDSVKGPRTFLFYNEQNRELKVSAVSAAWMEMFASYATTLMDRSNDRLNAGATVKLLKGLSGAHAQAEQVLIERAVEDGLPVIVAAKGSANYGYSQNHESATSNNGLSVDPANLLRNSKWGFAVDMGVEYLIKEDGAGSVFDDEDNNYSWKIGVSLMDIGWNNYTYSRQSRVVSTLKEGMTGGVLQEKFGSVRSISSFNDSLETIVNQSAAKTGNFYIMNPTRLKVNVDHYLYGNFFINGDLSLNLSALVAKDNLYVQESKVVTITPRWEKRSLGFYAPLQYNRQGTVWLGAAMKAGPLVMGTHNILNIFSNRSNISGGGYLALIIRPSKIIRDVRNRQYECPVY